MASRITPSRPTAFMESIEARTLFSIAFAPPLQSAVGDVSVATSGDFTGDGRVDLVARDGASDRLRLLVGRGDGTFFASPASVPGINAGARVVGLASGDVNRDGKLDLIAVNAASDATSPLEAGGVSVLLGNGLGGFAPATRYLAGPSPTAVATGDFNRDGRLDLAVANDAIWPAATPTGPQRYAAAILLGGNAGFGAPVQLPLPVPTTAVAVGGVPLSNAAALTPPTVAFAGPLLLSASTLPWTLAMIVTDPLAVVAAPNSAPVAQIALPGDNAGIAAGDLNRDGRVDVAALQSRGSNTTNASDWSVHTVVSQPVSSSTAPPGYAVAGSFASGLFGANGIAINDLDRNGRADVVVSGLRSAGPMLPAFYAAAAALPGAGNGLLRSPQVFATGGASPKALLLSDADRDGRADVLVTSASGLSTLLNRSLPLTAAREANLFTERLGVAGEVEL